MNVIVDYGSGNLGSIVNMMKKIGEPTNLSSAAETIAKADKLILPGVGAFDTGMRNLESRGLIPLLNKKVLADRTPILGICLGMQLMCETSEEGQLKGLGWIDAKVVRFDFGNGCGKQKVPHMGWNRVSMCRRHPLLAGLPDQSRFYFVHSYHVVCNDSNDVVAETTHGYSFTSFFARDNIMGVQFHPEKSHKYGLALLRNWALL
jgi:imidazole glycerol-phosphate synthase subunit HisH